MKTMVVGWILIYLLIATPVAAEEIQAQTPAVDEPLVLSLRDAIRNALEQNLELAVERQNPEIRRPEITVEKARFDPSLRLGVKGGKTIRPSASAADVAILGAGAVSPIESNSLQYDLGIEQQWSSGGRYTLAWDVTRQGGVSTVFDPNFGSALSVTVTQPLLKGFGPAVNRTDLILAQNNFSVSRAAFERKAAEIAAGVEEAYWELVYLRKNYKVELEKRRSAQELFAMNRAKVEQGLIAPIEILVAEAAVADREEDVLSAEKQVRDAEDRLRRDMNVSASALQDIPIIPADEPSVAPAEVRIREAVDTALDERRDLREARLELKNREQSVLQTRNQARPALDFEGTAGLNGLGSTYADDLDRLSSRDFYSWEAGVVFTLPLGNRAARSAYIRQKMELEKTALNLKKLEQDVMVELKEAVRSVETDQRRIVTTGKSRALADKKLETETERLRLGLSTTQNVLEFQKDLAEAQRREIRAIVDYNKSQTRLARARGTLLRDRGIVLESSLRDRERNP